jgi:hypothetical protein
MYTCRDCETEINQGTEVCPHCGADLTQPLFDPGAPEAPPTLRRILLRWGMLLGAVLAAVWSFLWFIVPERQGNPTTQAETRAADALREIREALGSYASAKNGAYPQGLEPLGEPVRTAAQLAQSVNYQIQYTPGPSETDGVIRTFTLQARAGNYGFRSFFTDDSGVMRATRENRAAAAADPPL